MVCGCGPIACIVEGACLWLPRVTFDDSSLLWFKGVVLMIMLAVNVLLHLWVVI